MPFVNEIRLEDITVNEIVPRTITFKEIPVQAGNTVTTARRYNRGTGDTTGTDISTKVSVVSNTNKAVLEDIWVSGDTPAAGTYRIQLVMRDSTGTEQKQEVNLIQKVTANA